MTNLFGAKSTTDQVLSGVNLHGKRILVTGVSAGIGIETARSLAAHGANVVGAARDLQKAAAATEGMLGYALDSSNAAALWKKSEEMVGEAF